MLHLRIARKRIVQSLIPQHVRRVGLEGECGKRTDEGIGMKHLGPLNHERRRISMLDKMDGESGESVGLVAISREECG